MKLNKFNNNYGFMYLYELGAKIVAESGRAGDLYHLGKLTLKALKDAPPEFVLQIDGGTGQSETCGSVLERSVQCANALRALGLHTGDVIVIMGPNHLDLCIPFYAALYLGVTIAPIDMTLGVRELQSMFSVDEPKIVFCQYDKIEVIKTALEKAYLKSKIVTFDGQTNETSSNLAEPMKLYGQDTSVTDFKASDFDTDTTLAFLMSTSGSTGLPKQAAHTHKSLTIASPGVWQRDYSFPTPTRMALLLSPLQWATAILQFNLSAIFQYTRVQSSKTIDVDHTFHLINTYRPTQMVIGPTMIRMLIKESKGRCDWTSYETILVGGEAVSQELIDEVKEFATNSDVLNGYGMSEIGGVGLIWSTLRNSSGTPAGHWQYRLINLETQEDIMVPNVSGELWFKGPGMFKGYYKNQEATDDVMTPDGWLKTGDVFYRDEYWNFYFVERIKLMIKYKSHQISPDEIQAVVRQHPEVLDVVVCGLSDPECGELPAAAVIRLPGSSVSAEDVKNIVKENLTDFKQLRGGVVFVEEFPLLPTGKVNRKKLKELLTPIKSCILYLVSCITANGDTMKSKA